MTIREAVHHRRSVRKYRNTPIDNQKVRDCLGLAVLAPNSSNMQLWEFYHITDPKVLKDLSVACLNQSAASTAAQMVVFITRQDLFRERAKNMIDLETQNVIKNNSGVSQEKLINRWKLYYGRVIPLLYARFFGVLGIIRKIMVMLIGLFRPMVLQVSESDMRVVVHKTCALAAQTFMLAMAGEGYDTCAMEGFDSRRAKNILKLPAGAEINMIVSCGIREESGVWGDRMRIPFEEVYRRV